MLLCCLDHYLFFLFSFGSFKYDHIEPYMTGFLQVSPIHNIYYEQVGNPNGEPVLFLHGGPGGGTGPSDRRYFDPSFYRVILIHQRGAGKSTPTACLEDNTTWKLIEDIEAIRELLTIETWIVFGGSWGSTLSLTYAETHPSKVNALMLRGIFTLRRKELLFFYQEGASYLFSDAFDDYLAPIPEAERGDMMEAYHKRLTGDDEEVRNRCALAWSNWEMSTSKLVVDPGYLQRAQDPKWALAFARIESHYFVNRGFFEEGYVLNNVDKIRHIPTTIVQGRYDVVCPFQTAWDLHKRFPEAKFIVSNTSGHSAGEKQNTEALTQAADDFRDAKIAKLGRFKPQVPPGGHTTFTFG